MIPFSTTQHPPPFSTQLALVDGHIEEALYLRGVEIHRLEGELVKTSGRAHDDMLDARADEHVRYELGGDRLVLLRNWRECFYGEPRVKLGLAATRVQKTARARPAHRLPRDGGCW